MIDWAPWWIGAYLVGSVPVGLLLARARGVDIRKHGSGNIGATNVWRVLGPKVGALCFALDVMKGLGPTLAAGFANHVVKGVAAPPSVALPWLIVAVSAIFGHMFPVWLRFKGGKGVATGLGALAGVYPVMTIAAGVALVIWIISAKVTKYVGVSSCLAAAAMPVAVLVASFFTVAEVHTVTGVVMDAWPYLVVTTLLAGVVIYKHRGNIKRTFAGTEMRIGQRVKAG